MEVGKAKIQTIWMQIMSENAVTVELTIDLRPTNFMKKGENSVSLLGTCSPDFV